MSLFSLVSTKNPWWVDPSRRPHPPERRRTVFHRLLQELSEPAQSRAKVLLGPRQVGKTTLLRQLACHFLDHGWPPANVLYFDFKDDRYDQSDTLRDVLDAKPTGFNWKHPRLLLLDEVTHAPNWDLAIKQLVDEARERDGKPWNPILITDSAAALMRKGSRDSLQGRIDPPIRIHGLTFREALRLLRARDETEQDVYLRAPGVLEAYLQNGGMPELLTKEPAIAWGKIRQDVTEGAIARDIAGENQVDVKRLTRLFRSIVQESGGLFEASNRAQDWAVRGEKGTDARTVRRWVTLLEKACLIEALDPWHPGLRRGVNKPSRALKVRQKLYAEDHGFIPAFSPFLSPMKNGDVRASVYETVVFSHLRSLRDQRSDFKLYYFREDDRMEIDFVLEFENAILGLEVTSSSNPKKKLPGLRRAAERADIDRVIVVHGGQLPPEKFDEYETCPIDSFLLDPETLINQSLKWINESH